MTKYGRLSDLPSVRIDDNHLKSVEIMDKKQAREVLIDAAVEVYCQAVLELHGDSSSLIPTVDPRNILEALKTLEKEDEYVRRKVANLRKIDARNAELEDENDDDSHLIRYLDSTYWS